MSKIFNDGTIALEPTIFSVAPGEFVSIIGPSGYGKSTLLWLPAGLETASGGVVVIDRGEIGHVFQNPTLLPWRSVQCNVELLMELSGVDKRVRAECARRALKLPGLTAFAHHKPRALSGDMRMRVSIARTLAIEPRTFLFDEPSDALDQLTRQTLVEELQVVFPSRALHRPVRHPFDRRGGVPQYTNSRDVAPSGSYRCRYRGSFRLSAGAVVAIWWTFGTFALSPDRQFLLPPPQRVVRVGILDPENFSVILGTIGSTASVTLTGLSLAIVVGTIAALLMCQALWVEPSLYPWAVVLQTLPILALVPLLGFWFGYGFSSRVLMCVLISLFPIITTTLFGLQSADRSHHELFAWARPAGAGPPPSSCFPRRCARSSPAGAPPPDFR
ncbi:ATP-binding cassette domain-containing protein [Nocardia brevicatena]|uniref:ATP-binding cassette domain-containing protein n=1 Tax=Nocardia brevicatena TaxID=37327 RepID=UPI0014613418|nr:ATP-binding cassette domain-containing protein [Nocardia brevicatena]